MGNSRNFFRIELDNPLLADMTIVEMRGQSIETGAASVLIDNISAGGLRYLSNLKLPASQHVILEFEVTILQYPIRLLGYSVRRREVAEDLYEYGVMFTIDDELQDFMVRLMNELAMRLRRTPSIMSRPPFFSGDVTDYFRSQFEPEFESEYESQA
ncbi:PilZ domain-containing protein [Brevibacillus dissolubilis]|uniref:PilZ domain-containing protein n=1 Tax=Brevibacillus dissolubilis TaxID=1844116 RepID=UPI00159BAC8F|nr:PilZ domain-containing protein [Brevibacillus dissolubilis]